MLSNYRAHSIVLGAGYLRKSKRTGASQKLTVCVNYHSKNSVALKPILKIVRNSKDDKVNFSVFKVFSIQKTKRNSNIRKGDINPFPIVDTPPEFY